MMNDSLEKVKNCDYSLELYQAIFRNRLQEYVSILKARIDISVPLISDTAVYNRIEELTDFENKYLRRENLSALLVSWGMCEPENLGTAKERTSVIFKNTDKLPDYLRLMHTAYSADSIDTLLNAFDSFNFHSSRTGFRRGFVEVAKDAIQLLKKIKKNQIVLPTLQQLDKYISNYSDILQEITQNHFFSGRLVYWQRPEKFHFEKIKSYLNSIKKQRATEVDLISKLTKCYDFLIQIYDLRELIRNKDVDAFIHFYEKMKTPNFNTFYQEIMRLDSKINQKLMKPMPGDLSEQYAEHNEHFKPLPSPLKKPMPSDYNSLLFEFDPEKTDDFPDDSKEELPPFIPSDSEDEFDFRPSLPTELHSEQKTEYMPLPTEEPEYTDEDEKTEPLQKVSEPEPISPPLPVVPVVQKPTVEEKSEPSDSPTPPTEARTLITARGTLFNDFGRRDTVVFMAGILAGACLQTLFNR